MTSLLRVSYHPHALSDIKVSEIQTPDMGTAKLMELVRHAGSRLSDCGQYIQMKGGRKIFFVEN